MRLSVIRWNRLHKMAEDFETNSGLAMRKFRHIFLGNIFIVSRSTRQIENHRLKWVKKH